MKSCSLSEFRPWCWRWLLSFVLPVAVAAQVDDPVFPLAEIQEMPVPVSQRPPEYPESMRRAGLNGTVFIEYIVDRDGRVRNPKVVQSNNHWFDRPVLDAVVHWRFRPGRINGRPVNTLVRQAFPFQITDGSGQSLWQVKRSGREEALPEQYRWHIAPEPINTAFPVYPFTDLQAGVDGQTLITFVIGPGGRVEASRVMEATTPAMGRAVAAMIETWEFKPARKADGTPSAALFSLKHEFKSNGKGDVPISDSARAILRQLKKSPEKIVELRQLDAPPRPLAQREPRYPTALQQSGQDGSAVIEFFLDPAGDAQLPRVVSATAPEFGDAAVQAVATWRYTPPLLRGKPVTARVQIPIDFSLRD